MKIVKDETPDEVNRRIGRSLSISASLLNQSSSSPRFAPISLLPGDLVCSRCDYE